MNAISLLVGGGLALGVGLMTHSLLNFMHDITHRMIHSLRRGRLQRLGLVDAAHHSRAYNPAEPLGLKRLHWKMFYSGSAFLGLFLFILLGPQVPGIRPFFLLLPALVWVFKRYLQHQRKRFQLGQVRQFLLDVRLHMSLQGSLLLGLEELASTTLEATPVYRSLQHCLKGSSAHSGVTVLEQMASTLDSPSLQQVVQQIQAAQQSGGVADVDQAIATVINHLNEEISFQSEEEMQHLPLRITLLSMPFLLGPIVILLFYPLVDRILKTLSGVSIGGGF